MTNRTKVAVIGCGKQAPKHISGLQHVPDVDIVLADRDESAASALAEKNGLPWLPSVEEVFADNSIDAVDICTPTLTHGELIRSAVASGKDFLCEKPLCEGYSEALELADLVEDAGRIGMVGYIYRFAPMFEQGRGFFKDLRGGGECMVLGDISVAHFRLGGRGSHQVWKHMRGQGGGAINEMLVHMVDLAVWYFGAVLEAHVLAHDLLRPRRVIRGEEHDVDAEDYVLVKLIMETGVRVFCQADLVTPGFTQFVEVQGKRGTFVGSIQPSMPSYLYLEQEVGGYSKGRTEFNFGNLNLFQAQMADFVQAVRSGEQPSRSTLRDSVLLMDAMMKIKREIGS